MEHLQYKGKNTWNMADFVLYHRDELDANEHN
jgi:hypothetical protein